MRRAVVQYAVSRDVGEPFASCNGVGTMDVDAACTAMLQDAEKAGNCAVAGIARCRDLCGRVTLMCHARCALVWSEVTPDVAIGANVVRCHGLR